MGWENLQNEIDSCGILKKSKSGFYEFNAEGINFCIGYNPLLDKVVLQYWYITERNAVSPTDVLFSPENVTQQKIFQEITKICEEKMNSH